MAALRTAAFFFVLLIASACEKDETVITASIEGRWTGTLAEVQVKPYGLPLPFKDDNDSFATIIEFHSDGTLVFFEDDVGRQGKYTINGDQLNIETGYTIEDIALSGTYTIQTLTDTNLVIFLEKEDQIIDQEGVPSVTGDIKITLHFTRA